MTDTQKLDDAIRAGLGLPDELDLTSIAYGETEEWDSVAHMQLVVALETAFGMMLSTEEVIAMSDYAAIRRILRDHHAVAVDA
jgi:acyl carrier protein